MLALIGLFVGAIVGNLLWRDWGAALGGIAGFLIGAMLVARRKAAGRDPRSKTTGAAGAEVPAPVGYPTSLPASDGALATRLAVLERRVAELERTIAAAPRAAETEAPPAMAADGTIAMPTPRPEQAAATLPEAPATPAPETPASGTPTPETPAPATPNPLWTWFTGGNALTRIGVVVLLIGVGFLLRYFAEHFTVPIEWRLAGVAAAGFALIAIGMRVGATRRGYGLSLAGAGGGVLYLTTYAASRLYGVLPDAAAIVLLIAVSALIVWLAWRNDSQPLAALAIAGGFLAPLLIAAGGDPLPLFAYFAVMNGAIFALAWTKAWRALNTLGFAFTFVGGLAWAYRFYQPEHFAVVEPFLVLFFAFYVTITILYARRGPLVAKNPVDGLLVFGVPFATFVLQRALMHDTRYGAAWSALALAAVYGLLFALMRNRAAPGFSLLSRAFLALAAIFATIAVPFAIDDRETAALWALEAAGAYWIGVRQNERLARAFALLVGLGAGIAFIHGGVADDDDLLFANAFFAGALSIGAAGLVGAFVADRRAQVLTAGERSLVPLVFAWGVLWWIGAGAVELVRQLSEGDELHAVLGWIAASVAGALLFARLFRWPRLAGAGVALLPSMAAVAVGDFDREGTTLEVYGWLVWPFAWVVHWLALRFADAFPAWRFPGRTASSERETWLWRLHAVSALALTVQLAWEASEWTGRITPVYTTWIACASALPPIVYLAVGTAMRDSARWPFVRWGRAYAIGAGIPIATLLGVWFLLVNVLSPGDPSPLPYWPIASPLDVTLALALWALIKWASAFAVMPGAALARWIGAALFVALNGLVLRTAHHWADIPWRLSSFAASKPLQAALTITWTATALAIMVVATRRGMRALWMTGAALLGLVVVKLFVVDLSALSGLPRVVAFLGVGVLLLAVGFFSPLPPAPAAERAADER